MVKLVLSALALCALLPACGNDNTADDADRGVERGGAPSETGGTSAGKAGATDPASGGEDGGSATSNGGSATSNGGSATSNGGSATSNGGSGSSTPLSDHELFLVGVWRGTISQDDQEFAYFVLQPDRTGCGWDRHGTNFGQRFFEYSFTDWHLEETPLDEDGRMTLRFVGNDGEEQAIERYEPATDRIFVGGHQPTSWLDLLIPCDSAGTNATQTDVERQGSMPPKP
jgi:hypothetical protein